LSPVSLWGEGAMPLSDRLAAEGNLGGTERFVSLLAGAALLFYGLARRPSVTSLALAAGGSLLLQRGASGHCRVYQALGIDTRGAASPPADMVDRDVELSFPASDPPSWSPHVAGRPAAR
jgi:uncharacterized membrane protein